MKKNSFSIVVCIMQLVAFEPPSFVESWHAGVCNIQTLHVQPNL